MKSLIIIIFIFLLSQVDAYHHGFLNSRIVGGRSAQPGQFPYIVSLKYKDSHVCGGSIISPNYILTAAHCFMHRVDGESIDSVFSIRAGSIYLEEGGVVISIEETMQHPGFNNLSFDIGLVRLKQPLNFTQHINSINLAESDPPMSANIVTAGWGSLGDDSTRSEILQYTTLSSLTNRECNQLYSNISESSLCLLPDPFILNSICRGDSGGPAVYNNELVGVASYVINGCGTKDPNVFVSVAYTADWIRENSDLN
uniref:Peptidase S1 domain-containing protein n=1 Tax=Glossina brevipalpis TaxID=37001 RepID=A0A1A9WSE3_9MUSC